MDKSKLIDEILDLCSRNKAECDFWINTGEVIPVEYEANRLKNIHTKEYQAISLRVIKDGRIGLSSTDYFDDPKALVDNALENARYGAEAIYDLPEKQTIPEVPTYDKDVADITVDEMVEMGGKLISSVQDIDPNIVCDGGVDKSISDMEFVSSKGIHSSFRGTGLDVSLSGTIIHGSDMLFIGDGLSSRRKDIDMNFIIDSVKKQYERSKNTAVIESGNIPVIFTPNGFYDAFIPGICSGFNGKAVYEKSSPLTGRLGEKAFDSKLSITDDATLPYMDNSRPVDGEGIPSRKLQLIKDGVIRNFIYDLKTAKLAGTQSTGHGYHGGSHPSFTNVVIGSGTVSQEEMIKDIKNGLLVEELMGAEQGNVLGGYFSGNVLLGYKIENGKIAGRVKDAVVSGNIYELLKTINAFGCDARWLGGLRTPSVYFPSVSCASH